MILSTADNNRVLCGAEEPIGFNQTLDSLDEASGQLVSGVPVNLRVNRYSFIWKSGDGGVAGSRPKPVVDAIVSRSRLPVHLVSCWSTYEEGPQQANTFMEKHIREVVLPKWEREGWKVNQYGRMYVAARQVSTSDDFTDWRSTLLVFGSENPWDDTQAHEISPSVRRFAWSGYLRPSASFIDWLSRRNLMVGYKSNAVRKDLALIFDGTQKLPIQDFIDSGLIQSLRRNEAATEVWGFGEHK